MAVESNEANFRTEYEESEREKLRERLKRCTALGFDVDGTLLDVVITYYQKIATDTLRELFNQLKKENSKLVTPTRATVNKIVREFISSTSDISPVATDILRLAQRNISNETLEAQIGQFWRTFYRVEHRRPKNLRKRMRGAGPYDVDALKPLQEAGMVLFLVSNNPTDILNGYQNAIKYYTGVTFPYAQTPYNFPDPVFMKKPNRLLFEEAVVSMQAKGLMDPNLSFAEIMDKTAFVGDDSTDVEFAQNVGAVPIWMNKVGEPPKGLAKLGPFLTYNSCEEIVEAILG